MSDILIKGMGIPKDYKYVDVRIFRDGTATTSSAEEPFYKKMDVVEVPTPHGRLGDLDKLEQMFVDIDNAPYSAFDGEEPFYTAEDAAQIIRLAPTIIESEEMNG